ncbi:bifunctional salicylyl-CoA 5-hydroxylase/oxidoreductase [Microbacterium album]|uniref:Salicylyl-CoA 5-hydroxylase n=1 Tax=Microbacterium album TaxID=2053191 RepID=A0A917IGE5_9MICO|nr:bifunctional salicylyl-CoA 5-hydroxylase/oxidoreductase [Microbacterium album]GGH43038.1 salicylyl-CoA 5-hydroxylase [Microbacterium album]
MRIAVIGGGPGGLYFSALMKQVDPQADITVWERNASDDTFGFGVVFSDETLAGIESADPVLFAAMCQEMARWSDIDVQVGGEALQVGGQGFSALSRKRLLQLLQERCADLGVAVHFRTLAPEIDELAAEYDLVVASDGLNSQTRSRWADDFGESLDPRRSKYMWLAVDRAFEAFTFLIKDTPYGRMQVHGYPYSATESTFIVEMHPAVWERAGFAELADGTLAPGQSDERSIARLAEIFAEELEGHTLLANNSKWLTFTTVRNERWHRDNVVLLGDAAHTAHFSIGSGTKLALEDALALAAALGETGSVEEGLEAYDAARRPVVLSLQRAAQASLEWFENIGQYTEQDALQFTFNLLTRSRRITRDGLEVRDPEFARRIDEHFAAATAGGRAAPAMFQPVRIGQLELSNRIVVAPMDMYSAADGLANDFHLVHLGSKALGGAGLVMTEMIGTSATGRITLGCTGLYTDEQADAWRRVVDFVHEHSAAKIGAQLGHSGRKGSTRLMWEGIDDPLEEGGWDPVGPSALPYKEGSVVPRELTRADMDALTREFAEAAVRADSAGFDLIELHAAHGYLLSSFLSPLSNIRTDEYGGLLENRLRYPLEVFDAVRAAWPSHKPLTVRLSAVDWAEGGVGIDDAVAIAAAFIDRGADAIHVSSGQVVGHERPEFGRSYQTPFADAIRNRVAARRGVPVIAVGAISSYDDVNSLLLAGRADLCALGRTHLYDPQWTLHAAAEQEYRGDGVQWPLPFRAGRRKPPTSRTDAVRPRLHLRAEDSDPGYPPRWRPLAVRA